MVDRRALFLLAAVALLGSCRWQLQGPPMVLEMPEVGAQVDVSGWIFQDGKNDPMRRNVKTEAGTKPASMRFAQQGNGWSSDVRFQATGIGFPNITVRRRALINQNDIGAKTLEGCAKNETGAVKSGAQSSWKLISPPVKKTIGGLEVLDVTNEVTVAGLDTPVRSRWVFIVKGTLCYAVGAESLAGDWDRQQYLIEPVFASIKAL